MDYSPHLIITTIVLPPDPDTSSEDSLAGLLDIRIRGHPLSPADGGPGALLGYPPDFPGWPDGRPPDRRAAARVRPLSDRLRACERRHAQATSFPGSFLDWRRLLLPSRLAYKTPRPREVRPKRRQTADIPCNAAGFYTAGLPAEAFASVA